MSAVKDIAAGGTLLGREPLGLGGRVSAGVVMLSCPCCNGGGIHVWRFRLVDGICVFMEFHRYMGPFFFRDRACRREIEGWWENSAICAALEWFVARGKRA